MACGNWKLQILVLKEVDAKMSSLILSKCRPPFLDVRVANGEIEMSRTRSKKLLAACVLSATFASTGITNAQFGNKGEPLDITGGGVAGSVAAEQSADTYISNSAAPAGPGLSRLPLTTEAETPVGQSTGDGKVLGVAGTSFDSLFGSQAVGTHPDRWPYATARVAVTGAPGPGAGTSQIPVTSRPYRYTGKLWMRFGSSWFVCTASLIKRGVLITAAHCVHNYGQLGAGFANEVRWYPANYAASGPGNVGGPWGFYQGRQWRILSPYWNGTDTCTTTGIVCNNDIATVVLWPKGGVQAGITLGGWNGYSWNGYSYPTSPVFGNSKVAAITQLGYPGAFDFGRQMQRNDSFGKYITAVGTNGQQLRNVQLGSAMSGGSSGGPWMVNFGTRVNITDPSKATTGGASFSNIVTAVTSWGYTNINSNIQGASWFGQNAEFPAPDYGGRGAGNIGFLVNATCNAFPAEC